MNIKQPSKFLRVTILGSLFILSFFAFFARSFDLLGAASGKKVTRRGAKVLCFDNETGAVSTMRRCPNRHTKIEDIEMLAALLIPSFEPGELQSDDSNGSQTPREGAGGAVGPIGPKGPTGDVGPAGPPGPQGATGVRGKTGPKGELGDAGPSTLGDKGLTGDKGPAGDKGPQGDKGITGDAGAQGPQGSAGIVGPKGPSGDRGVVGTTGTRGPTGAIGPTGPKGPKGIPGYLSYYLAREASSTSLQVPHAEDRIFNSPECGLRVVLGGGCRSGKGQLKLIDSYPANNRWNCKWRNTEAHSGELQVEAYAICAKIEGYGVAPPDGGLNNGR